ncbi:hypothetical protein [Clostridium tyrobutyricum]|nr:hypothetical protein [Clostridium tyrobutyricum]
MKKIFAIVTTKNRETFFNQGKFIVACGKNFNIHQSRDTQDVVCK